MIWFGVLIPGGMIICIVAQAYRYLRVSSRTERQQTKWILFGFAVGTSVYVALLLDRVIIPTFGDPHFPNIVYDLFLVPLFMPVLLVAPVTFTISMFRYRLFEVDFFIRRTLVKRPS